MVMIYQRCKSFSPTNSLFSCSCLKLLCTTVHILRHPHPDNLYMHSPGTRSLALFYSLSCSCARALFLSLSLALSLWHFTSLSLSVCQQLLVSLIVKLSALSLSFSLFSLSFSLILLPSLFWVCSLSSFCTDSYFVSHNRTHMQCINLWAVRACISMPSSLCLSFSMHVCTFLFPNAYSFIYIASFLSRTHTHTHTGTHEMHALNTSMHMHACMHMHTLSVSLHAYSLCLSRSQS